MHRSKRKGRYDPRVGKILFIAPAVVIIVVVLYSYVTLNSPGTLVVQAFTPGDEVLQVPVSVGGHSGTTPLTLSLSQGSYTVTFDSVPWYVTPAQGSAIVAPGQTIYSDGIYVPISKTIAVTSAGFNETTVTALHGVTPLIWVNPSGSRVSFSGGPFADVLLNPGQNETYTFQSAGSYQLTVSSSTAGSNGTLTVTVV